ncbi:type I site-specific restriction-modification system R (restriction) subunit [Arcanobacterium pluranimalium]|uniref:type I restriction enzyme endonuclease domain-containing protein n=1 Tax=Arcanobacterium pluranimalium TaxID=108028 RepID=UPI00308415BA|nr:type I site-specific restriction-modification system R (restriction) subunit [Arcanobacterium pluranimalium]
MEYFNDRDSGTSQQGGSNIDSVLGQLVNEAVTADQVIDVYQTAGMDTPELSLLSDDFLDSLKDTDKPNLQMGLLRRLLNDQIKTLNRTNLVQSRKFSKLLSEAVNRYTNRTLITAETEKYAPRRESH